MRDWQRRLRIPSAEFEAHTTVPLDLPCLLTTRTRSRGRTHTRMRCRMCAAHRCLYWYALPNARGATTSPKLTKHLPARAQPTVCHTQPPTSPTSPTSKSPAKRPPFCAHLLSFLPARLKHPVSQAGAPRTRPCDTRPPLIGQHHCPLRSQEPAQNP